MVDGVVIRSDIVPPVEGEPPRRLSAKQARVLSCRLLLGDVSARQVSLAAGVDHTSISDWRKLPWFADMWERVGDYTERIADALRINGSLVSLSTLIEAQASPESSTHDKIDAAKAFLTLEQRRREHESEPARMLLSAELARWAKDGDATLAGNEIPTEPRLSHNETVDGA